MDSVSGARDVPGTPLAREANGSKAAGLIQLCHLLVENSEDFLAQEGGAIDW